MDAEIDCYILEDGTPIFNKGKILIQHIQKYTDEFSFRYNNKGEKNIALFERAVKQAANNRLTYKKLTNARKELFSGL